MAWVILVIAGVFEVLWALGLKSSQGLTRLWPSLFTLLAMVLSFYLLSVALRSIPIGTAYTVWTGIGATGTVIAGAMLFDEPLTMARIGCLILIGGGIAGLRLLS